MKKLTKALAAIMLMTAVLFVSGCKPEDDPNNGNGNGGGNNNGGDNTYNGHEFVDLGLPSGTLWATCNVGANSPEEYGDYFAWGETEPKTTYDWTTYKYCNGDYDQLTKYCNQSNYGYNGFTDNLIVLQSGDDAATANWGSGWRMPTKVQWDELLENTTNTWTTWNDVYGRLFYGNAQRLFLPAAGCFDGGNLYYVGEHGDYWSGSLGSGPSGSIDTRDFSFCSGNSFHQVNSYRCGGLSVRPVRSER